MNNKTEPLKLKKCINCDDVMSELACSQCCHFTKDREARIDSLRQRMKSDKFNAKCANIMFILVFVVIITILASGADYIATEHENLSLFVLAVIAVSIYVSFSVIKPVFRLTAHMHEIYNASQNALIKFTFSVEDYNDCAGKCIVNSDSCSNKPDKCPKWVNPMECAKCDIFESAWREKLSKKDFKYCHLWNTIPMSDCPGAVFDPMTGEYTCEQLGEDIGNTKLYLNCQYKCLSYKLEPNKCEESPTE